MAVHLPTARSARVSRPFAPTIENIRRIIKFADENSRFHDLRDTVRVIVNTGISIGELANLRDRSLDPHHSSTDWPVHQCLSRC